MNTSSVAEARVRLPRKMHDRIRANAEANRRSMNSEIVHYLGRQLAAEAENGPAEAATSPDHGSSNSPQEKANEHV